MRDILLTALAPIAWGTTYFVTTQFLPPNRPLFVSVMRALPIGLLILARFRQFPRGIWWWRALALGTLNIGLFFALLFTAAYRLPGGVIATTNAIQPFVVATLAWAFLGEQLTTRSIGAAFAGVVGVGLIVLSPAARLDLIGVIAALAATITWAGGTVLTKPMGEDRPASCVYRMAISCRRLDLIAYSIRDRRDAACAVDEERGRLQLSRHYWHRSRVRAVVSWYRAA